MAEPAREPEVTEAAADMTNPPQRGPESLLSPRDLFAFRKLRLRCPPPLASSTPAAAANG
jgi:hypothetical protein